MMTTNKRTRFRFIWILVFSFLAGCAEPDAINTVTIQWENEKAIALLIPREMLPGIAEDSIAQQVQIRLAGSKSGPSILGEYDQMETAVRFRPLIPFTPGLQYEIWSDDILISGIGIPVTDPETAPEVLAVYPSQDTLPENLLKIHIRFSRPMQEGEALQHVLLIKHATDTASVFLDLQPELWNADRTLLTLWLDPGRIKRDLQPNKTMGPPLSDGEQCRLIILDNWRDAWGASLKKAVEKNFVVGIRDSISPNTSLWQLKQPAAGTQLPLEIDFGEPLDYVLLNNTISITDTEGNKIPGQIQEKNRETGLLFVPDHPWKAGTYSIETESRLEDLAGNNLLRLFDTDLSAKSTPATKNNFVLSFRVAE